MDFNKHFSDRADKMNKDAIIAMIIENDTLKNENENLISKFLKNHSEFFIESASDFIKKSLVSKEGWVKTTPEMNRLDGSFSVRLRKGN